MLKLVRLGVSLLTAWLVTGRVHILFAFEFSGVLLYMVWLTISNAATSVSIGACATSLLGSSLNSI